MPDLISPGADVCQRIDELARSLKREQRVDVIQRVREHALLLLERDGRAPDEILATLRQIKSPDQTRMRKILDVRPNGTQMAREVREVLGHVSFVLGLGNSKPLEAPTVPVASETKNRLLAMIADLEAEVEQSDALEDAVKVDVREALQRVRDALVGDPTRLRSSLEQVLGRAVVETGRAGNGSSVWRKVAEFVVVAEAAVSLGLGVAAITSSKPTEVHVVCNVQPPALPAGDPSP